MATAKQLKGQLMISAENHENVALSMAKDFLHLMHTILLTMLKKSICYRRADAKGCDRCLDPAVISIALCIKLFVCRKRSFILLLHNEYEVNDELVRLAAFAGNVDRDIESRFSCDFLSGLCLSSK